MPTVICTICGELTPWSQGAEHSALCLGCAPNMAQSLDARLRDDALQVPAELTREILAQCRSEQRGRWP